MFYFYSLLYKLNFIVPTIPVLLSFMLNYSLLYLAKILREIIRFDLGEISHSRNMKCK